MPDFVLNNETLKVVTKEKYLGIYVSDSINEDCDIDRQKKCMYSTGNMLIRKFKFCSDDVKHRLFNTYCSNIYGCHLWTRYTQSSMRSVKVAYNCIYRHVFNLSRYESISSSMVSSGINTVSERIRKCLYGFYTRLLESDNAIIAMRCVGLIFATDSRYRYRYRRFYSPSTGTHSAAYC